jgi:hypothetical protein
MKKLSSPELKIGEAKGRTFYRFLIAQRVLFTNNYTLITKNYTLIQAIAQFAEKVASQTCT